MLGNSDQDEDNRHEADHGTRYTTLRTANEARQREWDGNGHAMNDDWRMNELMGEAGEVCNVLKKLHRERAGVPGSRADKEMLADELADIVICLDLFLMTKKIGPAAPTMMFVNGDTLTANGRKLFSAVARLDTLAQFDDLDGTTEVWRAATDVHSRCLTLAATEGIDLTVAVAKKFNETTRKMGLTTFLHTPD